MVTMTRPSVLVTLMLEQSEVAVDSLKAADNAKITGFALNKATEYTGGTARGVDADGTDTDIGVTMGQTTASVVEIDTSVFSTTFKNIFKQDGSGVFTGNRC